MKKRLVVGVRLGIAAAGVLLGMMHGLALAQEGTTMKPPSVEEFFNQLSSNTMPLVDRFYSEDTHFLDPVVDLKGRAAVRRYYEKLYRKVESIRFEFSGHVRQGDEQVSMWTMVLRARGLNGGNEIRVIGNSHFRFDPHSGQALYHRDYFDMGEFIYERVPVLGGLIRYIKGWFVP